jgi:hypothetical protein
MKPYIDYAIDWYHKYIEQGVSPKMTEEDSAWLKTELEGVKS